MIIALDFDETFTEDPFLWRAFIAMAKKRGHEVTFVTFRFNQHDNDLLNQDIKDVARELGMNIVFTGGQQKNKLFDADIWIDDQPITIPKADALNNMYQGCLANNEQ